MTSIPTPRFPVPQDVQDNPYFWTHVGYEYNCVSDMMSKAQTAVHVWHMEYQQEQTMVCEMCGSTAWWRPTVGTYWCIDGDHPARKRQNRSVS